MSESNTLTPNSEDYIKSLVNLKSKHSAYQSLHPKLSPFISEAEYIPSGKFEAERFFYMKNLYDFSNKNILDIGANTGYFSFDAIECGAQNVTSYEGNKNHADFISVAAKILNLQTKVQVHSDYYNFVDEDNNNYDAGICLNVLHHLGDDFGDSQINIIDAKKKMSLALQSLSLSCEHLWFQIGYNWKGNRTLPLFESGTKSDVIDFIKKSSKNHWNILHIGAYNPESRKYEEITSALENRFDHIGEFLNRPIFLLKRISQ